MEKIKILIFSANPKDTNRLRLDEEIREIEEALERSRSRDRFELIKKSAVRTEDLRRAMLDYAPQIVHFSGHGEGNNGIALENDAGMVQLVSTQALSRLFKLFSDSVQCVFFNACYSVVQAEAICQHIHYVLGMTKAIGDRAAIEFARGFYDALGAGKSYEFAYEMGCSSIDLENIPEVDTPVLKTRSFQPQTHHSLDAEPKPVEQTTLQNSQSFIAGISLETLEIPEGQVPLDSPFYVERPPIEPDCNEAILRRGALIRIKAPRQMGKSSLMSRTLNFAAQKDYQVATLSLQSADAKYLQNLDLLLKWCCANISYAVGLENKLNDYWCDDFLGTKDKCTNYFQRYLLASLDRPLALGLDEVDEVFKHPEVAVDFFGLLRAWHERAKNDPLWQRLRLVITHSKEVYIPLNINQSPFNVGLALELPILTQVQVQDLAQRHGLQWNDAEFAKLMTLLGGHPFLVRVAFYQITRGRMTLDQLWQIAPTEEGPYQDHLRRHLLNLQDDPALLAAAQTVFANPDSAEVGAAEAFKLRSMGIVKPKGNGVIPLCDLYYRCFSQRLAG